MGESMIHGQITLDEIAMIKKAIEPIKNLRVGSCFSGVGMWELALKYIDIEHTQEFFIEWDKFPAASYKAIHGDVKRYEDVTKVDGAEVPDIDLFFYSPPCQAFSVAGKGLGAEEERGLLFNDALRIIKAKMPKICIMENVKGLTNKKHSEFFNHILNSLERAGYTNHWKILNTKDYGIPQNRERIFIVSIRNDIYNGFEFPGKFDNGIRLKHLLETEVDEKYYISEEKCAKLIEQIKDGKKRTYPNIEKEPLMSCALSSREHRGQGWKEESSTLCARDYKDPKVVATPCITPDRVEKRQNGRRFKEDGDPMFTLTSQDRHGVMVVEPNLKQTRLESETAEFGLNQPNEVKQVGNIVTTGNFENPQRGRIYSENGISPTLNCMQGGGLEPKILNGFRIRKLTPKECWRLQGIKDEDFDKAAEVNSNSQLYKQAGNGVSVNVVMELIKQLQKGGYLC